METVIAFGREAGRGLDNHTLPAYASMLTAYHRAQATMLRAMLAGLPLRPGDRVLDMACGDGCYAVRLAALVAPHGVVVAVDRSPAYLALAQREMATSPHVGNISLQTGDIATLPFDDGTFDLCWCAQSMYSLPEPVAALRELRRVTRPGGTVAVLENDTLHGIVLPWPADLELTVRQAQLRAIAETEPDTARFFIGRDLCAAFEQAGLDGCTITPYTAVHRTPLCYDERTYLTWYLDDLCARARPYLTQADRDRLDRLLDPASPAHLLEQPGFYFICIDILAQGQAAEPGSCTAEDRNESQDKRRGT